MKTLDITITGIVPLIVHNAQLADPLNYWTKQIAEISKKRGKTEEDHQEMARREFMGGLYLTKDGKPKILAQALERMIREAAKAFKKGKDIQKGLWIGEDPEIIYTGPKDPDKMWQQRDKFSRRDPVKVGQSMVIRTRATWSEWSLKFQVGFDPEVLNEDDVINYIDRAGKYVGLGDYRPRYGRFTVEVAAA